VLTGQGFEYNRTIGAIRGVALRPGRMALEAAARLSVLDLNSGAFRGGVARDVTLGVNWYLSRNYRVMANYVRSETLALPTTPGRSARVFAVRLQTNY